MKKIKVYSIRYLSPYHNYVTVDDMYKSYFRFLLKKVFLYLRGIHFSTEIYFIIEK